MAGDERVRHCTLCSLNVYNFAEMTRDEIRALLVRKEGRVCARLYRRADGTLLTKDCPRGLRAVRMRMSRFATAVVAALFSVSAFASDGKSCEKPLISKDGSKVKLKFEQPVNPQQAMFAGVVKTEAGDALPGVTVVLRDEATKREFTTVTDANGTFTIASVSDGLYRVEVTLESFTPAVIEHLLLKQKQITRAQVALRVSATMGVITVGVVGTTEYANEPLTTTFPQEMINKLPI